MVSGLAFVCKPEAGQSSGLHRLHSLGWTALPLHAAGDNESKGLYGVPDLRADGLGVSL